MILNKKNFKLYQQCDVKFDKKFDEKFDMKFDEKSDDDGPTAEKLYADSPVSFLAEQAMPFATDTSYNTSFLNAIDNLLERRTVSNHQ
jgi:hypothetical protein